MSSRQGARRVMPRRRAPAWLVALGLLALLAAQWAGLAHRIAHRPLAPSGAPPASFAPVWPLAAAGLAVPAHEECADPSHPGGHHPHAAAGRGHGHGTVAADAHGHAPGSGECRLVDSLTLADASAPAAPIVPRTAPAAVPPSWAGSAWHGAAATPAFLARGPPRG